ncbi:TolC family protein [Chryseobacterium sp.]|uniref:TolC family protein n=1 Tax=Chryseobacterium sp. TaxID=1871047 RepID=UPI0025BA0CB9|nr:TolC family protein [Chryseobacterium sp.]
MKKLILIAFFWGTMTQAQKVWTLQDCLDYAVTNNITVKKTVLDKNSAELNYQQQKNNKLPSLSTSASLGLTNGSSIDPITSDFVNETIFSNSYGVSSSVVLYQGNKLNLQIEKNKMLVDQSSLYQKQAENSIVLSVLESYLQALYYYEGIKIAEFTVNSSTEELKLTQIKYKNGAIAKLELADVETQHAQNQYNVVNSQNLYNQQVLKLKQLLELDPAVNFQIEKITLNDALDIIPDKQEVYAAAAESLPDVKLYDMQNTILNKDLEIAKAGYLPSVSLNAGLNTGYSSTRDFGFWEQMKSNFNKSVGLSVTIPIFSKKQNDTNVKLAQIDIEQNKLDKTSAEKTLYSSIETAWQNAIANQAQQEASKVARDNAKLAYELANKKFEFGGLTTTELAVSRNTYLSNEQTYLQSKYMAVLYNQLLNFYQGKTLTSN